MFNYWPLFAPLFASSLGDGGIYFVVEFERKIKCMHSASIFHLLPVRNIIFALCFHIFKFYRDKPSTGGGGALFDGQVLLGLVRIPAPGTNPVYDVSVLTTGNYKGCTWQASWRRAAFLMRHFSLYSVLFHS